MTYRAPAPRRCRRPGSRLGSTRWSPCGRVPRRAWIERPHAAGNSLGGWLVLELAKRGQGRSANALSPAGFASRPENAGVRVSLTTAVRAARWMAPRADALPAPRLGRALALNLFVAQPTRLSPADAAASVRALAGVPWFDATLPTIVPFGFTGGDLIPVPVTIAWAPRTGCWFRARPSAPPA